MGSPDFAAAILKSLARRHEVVAVYTQPDRPSGRGLAPTLSPVKKLALEIGLRVFQPRSLKPPSEVTSLQELHPRAVVVAAYGLLLPRSVLDVPPLGCINVHPSLLPRHRGASPVAAAILAGDSVTGVSIMLLGEGWDTGPVLAQASTPIMPADTTGSLTSRLAGLGADLLATTLPRWEKDGITPRPQDSALATYSQPLKKEEGEINWDTPAKDLERKVRAFLPWPGCYTRWRGKLLKVLETEVVADGAEPGKVVGSGGKIGVGTGDGILALKTVQLEGKRAMSIQDFVRGARQFIGAHLPDMG